MYENLRSLQKKWLSNAKSWTRNTHWQNLSRQYYQKYPEIPQNLFSWSVQSAKIFGIHIKNKISLRVRSPWVVALLSKLWIFVTICSSRRRLNQQFIWLSTFQKPNLYIICTLESLISKQSEISVLGWTFSKYIRYCEKNTKFENKSGRFFQIFAAFSEDLNFNGNCHFLLGLNFMKVLNEHFGIRLHRCHLIFFEKRINTHICLLDETIESTVIVFVLYRPLPYSLHCTVLKPTLALDKNWRTNNRYLVLYYIIILSPPRSTVFKSYQRLRISKQSM